MLCGVLSCRNAPQPPVDNKSGNVIVSVDTAGRMAQGDSLFSLALKYSAINRADSAIYFLGESLRLKKGLVNDTALTKNYLELGKLYRAAYKILFANEHLEQARQLAEQKRDMPALQLADLYLQLSYCRRELFDYAGARDNLMKAQAIAEREFPNDNYLKGRIHSTEGNIYYDEKQYGKATASYRLAAEYYGKAGRYSVTSSPLHNISIIYSDQKNYDSALHYLEMSIRLARLEYSEESEIIAGKYLVKAAIMNNLGHPDSAEFYYRKTLDIRLALFGEKNERVYGVRHRFAGYFLSQGMIDSAANYMHGALKSQVRSFNDESLLSLPVPDASEISKDLAWALTENARALSLLYNKQGKQELLEAAIKNIRLADSVFSVYRQYLPFEDQQFTLMQSGEAMYDMGLEIPYEIGLECARKLFESSGEQKYLEDALYFMENSRAKRLAEALRMAESYSRAGIPGDIQQQQSELYRTRAEILQAYHGDASDSLNLKLARVGEEINAINNRLNEINPNYLLIRHAQLVPDIMDLKKLAKKLDAVLLEYYWSDEKVFVLGINKQDVTFRSIHITEDLSAALDNVLKSLASQSFETTDLAAYKLFVTSANLLFNALLSESVRESKESRLVISPHGRLSFLPFEVLLETLPDTTEVNYKLPYLVRRFTLSYTQAFQLLDRTGRDQPSGSRILAIGFSTLPIEANGKSRSNLQGLPGTEREINSIREVMRNHTNAYYLGPEASETMLKQEAPKYNILHLAVHGQSDPHNALNSRLVFRNEQDSLNDGNLYAHELYAMDLRNSGLVVLSACESGIGKPQPGEGLLSISRGFAYAGCPAQVISLWKINDWTSAQVMGRFYRELSKGKEVDVSLAQAKLAYLTSANEFNTHPSYWAAFLSVGGVHAVHRSNSWLLWAGGILLLILSGGFVLWRYFQQ